ncbi:hypothetical protein V6N13_072505 [Hibiscus sabdariffa]|uniref:Uncharacterized protein n=1 Tax=Hibiscus sabdariffa TaxID=183260 RepID=A0ABR2R7Z3_9ROSI
MDGAKREDSSVGEVSSPSFFSSAEEIFMHGIPEPPNQHPHSDMEEGEISVFGAEKYFNMELDDACPRFYNKYSTQIHQHQMTPTAGSETSWTSQSVWLPSFMRDRFRSVNKQNVHHGRKDYSNEPIQIDHRYMNMNRMKPVQAKFQVKNEFNTQSFETRFDNPGKSEQVLGSSAMNKVEIGKSLEKKLCMLTWDAIPRAPTISSIYKSRYPEDDDETEGSSDLFEIGGQASESDGMSSCMMTPYAPSETSIEWSVVTASAADCSFVSGYDDETISAKRIRAPASKAAGTAKEAQRSRAGGLLGCRKHKAVMVAESAYRKRW